MRSLASVDNRIREKVPCESRLPPERQRGDRVTGTLVVRINGEWVVAELAPGAKALTGK
jgi:hypothetical protein